jgi:hypothetical protein
MTEECDHCQRETGLVETAGGQYCAVCVDAHHDPGAKLNLQEVSVDD